MKRLRKRLSQRDSEAGLTLIELLVASSMSVVLVGAVTAMLISTMRAQPKISERSQNVSTTRWVMERLTREIRNGVRVDIATPSQVSILTYVRRTSCNGSLAPSTSPAIKCQVTYECTTTSCTRREANEGVYTGTGKTVLTGMNSSSVFCFVPSSNPDPLTCGETTAPADTTYIGLNLRLPNPSGTGSLTVTDGASLRNAILLN